MKFLINKNIVEEKNYVQLIDLYCKKFFWLMFFQEGWILECGDGQDLWDIIVLRWKQYEGRI